MYFIYRQRVLTQREHKGGSPKGSEPDTIHQPGDMLMVDTTGLVGRVGTLQYLKLLICLFLIFDTSC